MSDKMQADNLNKTKRCLEKFIAKINRTHVDGSFEPQTLEEFMTLRELTMRIKADRSYSIDIGLKPANRKKNRYKDIIPFDPCRVELDLLGDMEDTDYINASFLRGPGGSRRYIAAQGPLPVTTRDFWRMIYDYDVRTVVMVCNEKEQDKVKCERYWPMLGDTEMFGLIYVKMVSDEAAEGGYRRRELEAEGPQGKRSVVQFHLQHWPDHGIIDVDNILKMIAQVRNLNRHCERPIVVHCSAGCGRTGCIIAIDYVWSLMALGDLSEDFRLFDVIESLRHQRTSMVQTHEQYKMVHVAIAELFKMHLDMMERHNYENTSSNSEHSETVTVYEDFGEEGGSGKRRSGSKSTEPEALAEQLSLTLTSIDPIYTSHVQPREVTSPELSSKDLALSDVPALQTAAASVKPCESSAEQSQRPAIAPTKPARPSSKPSLQPLTGSTSEKPQLRNSATLPARTPQDADNLYSRVDRSSIIRPRTEVETPTPPVPSKNFSFPNKDSSFEYSYVNTPTSAPQEPSKNLYSFVEPLGSQVTEPTTPKDTTTSFGISPFKKGKTGSVRRGLSQNRGGLDLGHKVMAMFSGKKKDNTSESLDSMAEALHQRKEQEQDFVNMGKNISFPHRVQEAPQGQRDASWK